MPTKASRNNCSASLYVPCSMFTLPNVVMPPNVTGWRALRLLLAWLRTFLSKSSDSPYLHACKARPNRFTMRNVALPLSPNVRIDSTSACLNKSSASTTCPCRSKVFPTCRFSCTDLPGECPFQSGLRCINFTVDN